MAKKAWVPGMHRAYCSIANLHLRPGHAAIDVNEIGGNRGKSGEIGGNRGNAG